MRTISLTMIVRDESALLDRCLSSVRDAGFDQIVVVDTGSKDEWPRRTARDHGAEVHDFAWCDDFAAARNASLSHATGDYAMWLDADEYLEPAELPKLRYVMNVARHAERPAAYAMRQLSIVRDGSATDGMEFGIWHVRLWPLGCGIEWSGKLHENLVPSINANRIKVAATEVCIRHTGFEDREIYAAKSLRNRRIAGGDPEPRFITV
jgi:glycosyltransferase involved in cell wall biosynthesis